MCAKYMCGNEIDIVLRIYTKIETEKYPLPRITYP